MNPWELVLNFLGWIVLIPVAIALVGVILATLVVVIACIIALAQTVFQAVRRKPTPHNLPTVPPTGTAGDSGATRILQIFSGRKSEPTGPESWTTPRGKS